MSAELKGGPGKPRTARSEIIRNTAATLLTDDARITLRSMAAILQVSLATTHRIAKEELGFSRICARWIPRLLTDEMKAERVRVCQLWIDACSAAPDWLTADESWMYAYDLLLKQ